MRLPAYNAPAKKSIEISLSWHSSIADMNHDIVSGKLNKCLKPQTWLNLGARKTLSGALATIPITLRVILLNQNL